MRVTEISLPTPFLQASPGLHAPDAILSPNSSLRKALSCENDEPLSFPSTLVQSAVSSMGSFILSISVSLVTEADSTKIASVGEQLLSMTC